MNVTTRLVLRQDGVQMLSKRHYIPSSAALARRMNIDPGQLSRALHGKAQPGPQLICGLITVFGAAALPRLLTIEEDNEEDGEDVA